MLKIQSLPWFQNLKPRTAVRVKKSQLIMCTNPKNSSVANNKILNFGEIIKFLGDKYSEFRHNSQHERL